VFVAFFSGALAAGVTQVFTDAQGVVRFDCIFGDPYSSAAHTTKVTMFRQQSAALGFDYYWNGFVESTFNQ
jgi:hypothetical protein